MVPLPPDLSRRYTTHLAHHGVAHAQQPQYSKWLRYYWDFCHKYAQAPTARQSLPAFREKLRSKQQSEAQCQQAEAAVSLYYEMVEAAPAKDRQPPAEGGTSPGAAAKGAPQEARASSPSSLTLPDPALSSSPTASPLPLREADGCAAACPHAAAVPRTRPPRPGDPGQACCPAPGSHPGAGRGPPARGGGSAGDRGQLGGGVCAAEDRHSGPPLFPQDVPVLPHVDAQVPDLHAQQGPTVGVDGRRARLFEFSGRGAAHGGVQPEPGVQRLAVFVPACPGEGVWAARRGGAGQAAAVYSGRLIAGGSGSRAGAAGVPVCDDRHPLVRLRAAVI